MSGVLLLFALYGAPFAAQPAASEDHVYSWIVIESQTVQETLERQNTWLDENWDETLTHNDSDYPVVLLRTHIRGPKRERLIDLRIAIDCDNRTGASISGTSYDKAGAVQTNSIAREITFGPMGAAGQSGFEKIFEIACATSDSE
jgi:hypothetical protein